MLKAHMDAKERHLLAISQIPANAGHNLHKGTPREAFIREFLDDHLSERVATGTGEVIDSSSRPNQPRNQIDIVVYRRDYPKLSLGGGVSAFLAESVVATIEVKSVLDQAQLATAAHSASNVKALKRQGTAIMSSGWVPPAILSYVVAYDGPAQMRTVHGWISQAYQNLGLAYPVWGITGAQRFQAASPAIDGVFVLGKGFVVFDNSPLGFVTDPVRAQHPNLRWAIADTPDGNLLYLFTLLTEAVAGALSLSVTTGPYLSSFTIGGVAYGT